MYSPKAINFAEVKNIKRSVTDVRDEDVEKKARELYQEALLLMSDFYKTKDRKFILQATDRLFTVIKIKRNFSEPYVLLACIFNILQDEKLAKKYLRIAESYNPSSPKVLELKQVFSISYVRKMAEKHTHKAHAAEPVSVFKFPDKQISKELRAGISEKINDFNKKQTIKVSSLTFGLLKKI